MRNTLLVILFFSVGSIHNVRAQEFAQPTLAPLLQSYMRLKNALVKSDALLTTQEAYNFLNAMSSINSKKLTSTELAAYLPLNDELLLSAKRISESKNLATQREHFAALSLVFHKLVKDIPLSQQEIYYAYCPMKKSYWLSTEKDIKNPYYGKEMLNCGKIVAIIEKK